MAARARPWRAAAGRPEKARVTRVCSAGRGRWCRPRQARACSGQRRKPVPICAADAPSIRAAATPRASAIPPVATTGTFTADDRRQHANSPTSSVCALAGSKAPRWPPPPCPGPRSRPHRPPPPLGFGDRRGHWRPFYAPGLMRSTKAGIEAHDRGDDGRPASSMASHWAAKSGSAASPASRATSGPSRAGRREPRPRLGVARGRGSGIQRLRLKPPLLPARTSAAQALMARLHQQGAAASQAAGIGDGDRQRGGAGAGHRRQQDGQTQA